MAKINLLPWREERRQQRNTEFYVILGAAAGLGLVLLGGLVFHYGNVIDSQEEANKILRDEIVVLDRRIKDIEALDETRDRLLARKAIIEELQKNRSLVVRMFDQLVRTIPDGMRLTELTQQGSRVVLEGFADSNSQVSTYMRNLEASEWMRGTELEITETALDDETERYQFKVAVVVAQDSSAPEDGLDEDES